MVVPKRLQIGDTIGVVATSTPIIESGEATIERGYDFLRAKGFKVQEGASCRLRVGHAAGTIEDRVADIHALFRDPGIHAVMAFWGGLNTNELLTSLDWDLIRANPKIVIGFSDTTALTTAITKKTDLVTFSGPAVISFAKPDPFEYTWDSFYRTCIEPSEWTSVTPSATFADDAYYLRTDSDHRIIQQNPGWRVFRSGRAEGRVIAGNLQTLLTLVGTEFFPDVHGCVLCLEDDEQVSPAMVDRLFCQARQSGLFDHAAGLLIGRFASSCGFSPNDSLDAILEKNLAGYSFPVITDVDFGHTDPVITIPHGGTCRLDTNPVTIAFTQAVQ